MQVWQETVKELHDSNNSSAWKVYEDQAQKQNAYRLFRKDAETAGSMNNRFAASRSWGQFAATVCALRHVTHSRGRCSCHLFVCPLICVCRREREDAEDLLGTPVILRH
jgi:hypothetical protein